MIAAATCGAAGGQLTLADARFPAFARHLVKHEMATARELLDVIEQPARHERAFLGFLCGINTDEWRRWDTWEEFLFRNVEWKEHRETGIEIETPQLLADLTYIPADDWPQQGEKISFTIPAYDKLICPDVLGRWSLVATAFREERQNRPIVIWDIEPSC